MACCSCLRGCSLIFKLKGTVILKIWKQMIFIILYTAAIVAVEANFDVIKFPEKQTLIPVLGVVTGLLLVFRTNTAYDRYYEGRRLWSTMTQHIRTITRLLWIGVKEPSVREIIEKKTALNILIAFAYATKSYLREEYDYDMEDIRHLTKHLPKFGAPPNGSPVEPEPLQKKSSKKDTTVEIRKDSFSKPLEADYNAHDWTTPTNIPVELSYYLQSYIEYLRSRELCDGSLLWTMTGAIGNLMDCFVGFERILRTPIPLAYAVHLHHAVWLYLLCLPYQLVGSLEWWTVPAVALASFALIGILCIGYEIENPFGYDDNDLPLDDSCRVIRQEIQTMTGKALPKVDSWLWSSENQPLAPESLLTAEQLAEKSVEELRDIIRKTQSSKTNLKSSSSLMSLFQNIKEDPEKH